LYLALLRVLTHFSMKLRPLLTDLAHVAQHQQVWAGQACQQVNGGPDRVGVGVVAVVHQSERAASPLQLAGPRTALYGLKLGQALGDCRQTNVGSHGARHRRQRIA
jgi:hypothetical protein